MRKIVASLGFALAFLLSGCTQGPVIAQQISDPHVVIENPSLYEWLEFDTINYIRRDDGMLQFEAAFRNFSDRKRVLAYRVDWYDENGFAIKTILSKWTIVQVEERRNLIIHGISPTDKTQDFKIRLQKPTSDDDLRKNSYHQEYQGN